MTNNKEYTNKNKKKTWLFASTALFAATMLIFGALIPGTSTVWAVSEETPAATPPVEEEQPALDTQPLIGPEPEETTPPATTTEEEPAPTAPAECDPAYTDTCVPVTQTDVVNCADLSARGFKLVNPEVDPQNLDGDDDGVACETIVVVPVENATTPVAEEETPVIVTEDNATVIENETTTTVVAPTADEIKAVIISEIENAVISIQNNDTENFYIHIKQAIFALDQFQITIVAESTAASTTTPTEEEPAPTTPEPTAEPEPTTPTPTPTAPEEEEYSGGVK
jgi:hypothetical protein